MKKLLCASWVLALVAGCATPDFNYVPVMTSRSEPPLGVVVTAYVGDSMVRQGTYAKHEALNVLEDIKVGIFGEYTITRGYFLKVGDNDNYATYNTGVLTPDGGRIRTAPLSDPVVTIIAYHDSSKICTVTVFSSTDCIDSEGFERTYYEKISRSNFQQTLIYSGRIGDKINIGYREFSSDQARPAFNNDVEYDLGVSSIIGYKGASVEVIEATNQLIKYKLLSNFR